MRSAALLITLFVSALCSPDAEAKRERTPKAVKVCSHYGNGCMVAPVRQGRFGLEARLKSGTWISCRGDCDQAIREDVLDFWETQADKAMIATP